MSFESLPQLSLNLPEHSIIPYKESDLYHRGQIEGTWFNISSRQASTLDNLIYGQFPVTLTVHLLQEQNIIATKIEVERIEAQEEGIPSRYFAYIAEESIPLPVHLVRQNSSWRLEFDF